MLVNKLLYYPGDSFALPEGPVAVLAVPAAAPWMKVAEAMDFITQIKPRRVFPTHNAILPDTGMAIHNRLLGRAAESSGGACETINSGESVDIQP